MRKFIFSLTVFSAGLVIAAAQPPKAQKDASATEAVSPAITTNATGTAAGNREQDYMNPNSKIKVMVGKEFSLVLASNPTTGYSWQLAQPLEAQTVALVTNTFQPPNTQLVGAGGEEIWKFKALSAGQTIISLKYVRPWEKDKDPVKIMKLMVVVVEP